MGFLVVFFVVSCGAGTTPVDTGPAAEPRNNAAPRGVLLTVEVEGLTSDQGIVLCTLFRGPEGFPSDATTAERKARQELPAEEGLRFRFEGLEPGTWAVAVVHDENANGELDRGVLGIPSEAYGVSQNPSRGLGAPGFDQAALQLEPGEVDIIVKLRKY